MLRTLRGVMSAALVLSFVSGCGTVATTHLNVPIVASSTFELVDNRPVATRASSTSVSAIGSISRLGDDAITPNAEALVRSWLYKAKNGPAGKRVVLQSFIVEIYDPEVTVDGDRLGTASAGNPFAGAIAGGLVYGIERMRSDKSVSVKIELQLDDQVLEVRRAGSFKGRVMAGDLNTIITDALDALVREALITRY